MKTLISILKFIAAPIYACIIGYLLWLPYVYATPWIMGFSWQALFVYIIAGSFIIALFRFLSYMVMYPLVAMKLNVVSKILPAIILGIFCVETILIPYRLNIEYNVFSIILGICVDINILGLYFPIFGILFSNDD